MKHPRTKTAETLHRTTLRAIEQQIRTQGAQFQPDDPQSAVLARRWAAIDYALNGSTDDGTDRARHTRTLKAFVQSLDAAAARAATVDRRRTIAGRSESIQWAIQQLEANQ